ncbi:MAG: hypothetical protein ACR2K3_10585 [Nocardioides sp.]
MTGPTRRQAAGPWWRQTSPGRYVPSAVDSLDVEQHVLEQAFRLGGYGAVTAWASLRWRGAGFFDATQYPLEGLLPVPVVLAGGLLRPDPRLLISRAQLAPSEWEQVRGIRCTTVQRALFDEVVRRGQLRSGVVAVDMAMAAGLISCALLIRYVAECGPRTGVRLLRKVLRLASEGSRSPQETLMRLIWILDAALPPPLCNVPVFDLDGHLLGIPDLFDEQAGLVGEYDGAHHKEQARHQRDVAREDRFRDAGLEYFELVGGDLRDRSLCVDRMRRARSRAKFLPPESRAWTLQPPPWYAVPATLDERLRALGLADRLWRR